MATLGRKPASLVGAFLRQKREFLKLSQRQLGMRFSPPVTTQFISNLERGVTPLPPHHVPTLARELQVAEQELLTVLELEYAQKISDRIHSRQAPVDLSGVPSDAAASPATLRNLVVEEKDAEFIRAVYQAYSIADRGTKESFASVCEKILRMTR